MGGAIDRYNFLNLALTNVVLIRCRLNGKGISKKGVKALLKAENLKLNIL